MIEEIVEEMKQLILKMNELIDKDIEDIKKARHEKLLERNDDKQDHMNKIVELREKLDNELVAQMQNGVDINIYRNMVDNLENDLNQLKIHNQKLATIVMPIQQMYKDIVEELTKQNGGNIVEIKV